MRVGSFARGEGLRGFASRLGWPAADQGLSSLGGAKADAFRRGPAFPGLHPKNELSAMWVTAMPLLL